jgi:hypothetical protein
LLAVIAVAARPTKRRLFWSGVAVLATGYALGAHTPIFNIAYYLIPGVKKVRAGSMIMFWFSFAAVLLSSFFIDDVSRHSFTKWDDTRRKKFNKGLLFSLLGVTVLTVLFSIADFSRSFMSSMVSSGLSPDKSQAFEANLTKNFVPALWGWWFIACSVIGLTMALLSEKIKPIWFTFAILALGIVDAARVDLKFIETTSSRPYFYVDPALKLIANETAKMPARCFVLPGTLPQNGDGVAGIEGVNGFHDNELQCYRDFRGSPNGENFLNGILSYGPDNQPYLDPEKMRRGNAFLNLANAKYYVGRQGNSILSFVNDGALGRMSFASSYIVLPPAQVPEALKNNAYSYRSTVALAAEPAEKIVAMMTPDSAPQSGLERIEWKLYTPNNRIAHVNIARDGYIRLAEVFYPGWKILVDGKKVSYYQADGTWIAFAIKQGSHVIQMKPQSLYLGKAAMVSFILIGLTLAFWIFLLLRSRRKG